MASVAQEELFVLCKSLQNERSFLQRVTPDCGQLFHPVKVALSSAFIPVLFGHSISVQDNALVFLSTLR